MARRQGAVRLWGARRLRRAQPMQGSGLAFLPQFEIQRSFRARPWRLPSTWRGQEHLGQGCCGRTGSLEPARGSNVKQRGARAMRDFAVGVHFHGLDHAYRGADHEGAAQCQGLLLRDARRKQPSVGELGRPPEGTRPFLPNGVGGSRHTLVREKWSAGGQRCRPSAPAARKAAKVSRRLRFLWAVEA